MHLNLTLASVDLGKTETFYREVLLFPPEAIHNSHTQEGYLILRYGGLSIVFQSLVDMEQQHPVLLQNLTRTALGVGVQLELSCDNLDEIYRMVHTYHWPIAYELEDHEHQRRELWLHDPDGYLLVLNQEEVV